MGNAPIGNNFWEGPLGVVNLNFDSMDLGKTTDETELEYIEDLKEIFYAQDGTQPAELIPTGQGYRLTCKLAELTPARLAKLMRGFTVVGNSVKLAVDLYRSGKTNFAKALTVTRADSDGTASTDPLFKLNIYKAFPKVSKPATFGPENQRTADVEFIIFRDATHSNAFGYSGYASSLGL